MSLNILQIQIELAAWEDEQRRQPQRGRRGGAGQRPMPVAPDPPTRPVPPPTLPSCIGKDAGCSLATDDTGDFYMTRIKLELAGTEIDKLVDSNESRTECMRSFYR